MTCRKTKEFLSQKKVQFHDRDFFKDKFSRAEIEALLKGKPAREMFNFRSPSVKALELQPEKLNNDELIDWMLKEPRLIRRPVARVGQAVYFGADSKVLQSVLE
jgi:arsenate reductase